MKKIHLIRHAKSSWEHRQLSDQQRPLSQRGINDCGIMAVALYEAGVQFGTVFCSQAKRAQLTIQGIAAHWPGKSIDWQISKALYTFSSSQIWHMVKNLDDNSSDMFLIGHNPAFTDFINEANNTYVRSRLANFPTCAYAALSFAVDFWAELEPNTADFQHYLKPKMFK